MEEFERFYLDNLEGKEAYLEVNWNPYVKDKNIIRLVVGKETTVINSEDLETILLAFTRRPDKFLKNESRKMGLKYVPVPIDQYRAYKKHKEEQEFLRKRNSKQPIF